MTVFFSSRYELNQWAIDCGIGHEFDHCDQLFASKTSAWGKHIKLRHKRKTTAKKMALASKLSSTKRFFLRLDLAGIMGKVPCACEALWGIGTNNRWAPSTHLKVKGGYPLVHWGEPQYTGAKQQLLSQICLMLFTVWRISVQAVCGGEPDYLSSQFLCLINEDRTAKIPRLLPPPSLWCLWALPQVVSAWEGGPCFLFGLCPMGAGLANKPNLQAWLQSAASLGKGKRGPFLSSS